MNIYLVGFCDDQMQANASGGSRCVLDSETAISEERERCGKNDRMEAVYELA